MGPDNIPQCSTVGDKIYCIQLITLLQKNIFTFNLFIPTDASDVFSCRKVQV
jgi:UDP-N-acetylglucosamine pyrophosphorylase